MKTPIEADSKTDYQSLAKDIVRLMGGLRSMHTRPGVHDRSDMHRCRRSRLNNDTDKRHAHFHEGRIPQDLMDVGRGAFGALCMIAEAGGKTTPTQLCEMSHLSKGRVSNIIRRLEAMGYVEKTPSPEDSRSVVVSLTAKGKKVASEHEAAMCEHVASMLELLGPEDAKDAVRILRHMSKIVEDRCSTEGVDPR